LCHKLIRVILRLNVVILSIVKLNVFAPLKKIAHQVSGLFVVDPDVEVAEVSRKEIVDFAGHVQNVSYVVLGQLIQIRRVPLGPQE